MVNTTNTNTYIEKYPRALINDALDKFLESIYFLEKYETEKFGISWDEILLLKAIQKQPGSGVTQLADYMATKPFVVSRMLSKLEASGHVHKENSTADKRFFHQYLTEKGSQTLLEIDALNFEIVSQQLCLMSNDHAQMILSVISHLGDLLKLPE